MPGPSDMGEGIPDLRKSPAAAQEAAKEAEFAQMRAEALQAMDAYAEGMMIGLKRLLEGETLDLTAKAVRTYFEKLLEQGFTEDQAIRIAANWTVGGGGS